tara:strand:+ start:844 stop:1041 length:198 start_codon:yes stop_codon:yes gene_type:complete
MEFTEEQIKALTENFMRLSEKDKEALRKFLYNSREARILRAVMGPEIMNLIREIRRPKKGIAAPK